MKIELVQMDCQAGDIAANTAAMLERIQAAAAAQCDAVVFPEMADVGYELATAVPAATRWDSGALPRLCEAAARHNIHVIAGLAERCGNEVRNGVAVIDRRGQLVTRYHKIHLITVDPICEQNHIAPGEDLCLFELDGLPCGLMTCYDVRFPELARALALSGAELLIVPAAFPAARIAHWNTLTQCRAIENQLYVAACNRAGTDAGIPFGGNSRLIGPAGELLAELPHGDPGSVTGDIDPGQVAAVRSHLHIWEDRRPDLYQQWPQQR